MSKKTNKNIKVQLLKGFKDILPEHEKYWFYVVDKVIKIVKDYNLSFINTPVLEEAQLFERTVGEGSDIVHKEMYKFNLPKGDSEDGGKTVVLRPEGTAAVMRAYIEHGMLNQPQPVKLWYLMPMFRREKPQSGRFRQHHQFGIEVIGDQAPVIDAQVMIIVYSFLKYLGLDIKFPVNSIGDRECRPAYINALTSYLSSRQRQLCTDCKRRLKTNPLRVLDCKEEKCQLILEDAPQIVDYLCDECRNHFVAVLEYLDELDIPYELDNKLVRGIDYYERTTFEVVLKNPDEDGKNLSLGGGGRYDGLSEQLGGRPAPGVGVGLGIERIIGALRTAGVEIPSFVRYEVFIAQLGKEAKKKALRLFEDLKAEGWRVAEAFSKDSLSTQLEKADKLGVQYALILGQKEIMDGTIILRDMSSGMQEEVNFEKIKDVLKKRITQPQVIVRDLDDGDQEKDGEN